MSRGQHLYALDHSPLILLANGTLPMVICTENGLLSVLVLRRITITSFLVLSIVLKSNGFIDERIHLRRGIKNWERDVLIKSIATLKPLKWYWNKLKNRTMSAKMEVKAYEIWALQNTFKATLPPTEGSVRAQHPMWTILRGLWRIALAVNDSTISSGSHTQKSHTIPS